MDFDLGRALVLDAVRELCHGGPGDLHLGLVVVAAVDGKIDRTAVAEAPAPAGFGAQGGVAGQVPEVVGDLVVGGQKGPRIVRDVAVDGNLWLV